MNQEEKLTKKELKILKKIERLETEKKQKKQNFIKWILISISSLLFLVLFGFILTQAKQNAGKVDVPITNSDYIYGDKNAKSTIVEFSDFQCPACRVYSPLIKKVVDDEKGKVNLVFKHFPLDQHKNATTAAIVAEAAGKQNKFYQMHDVLFEKQDEWKDLENPKEVFLNYAKNLDLDTEKFEKDISSDDIDVKIAQDKNSGISIGLQATPTFIINGKIVQLPPDYNEIKKIVDEQIK